MIDLSPKSLEADRFLRLKELIHQTFPIFDDGAVTHAANNITNEIRRGHFDCYGIDVSRQPMDDNGHYTHFVVEASGIMVYVRITVD
ncbi:hypothetical protein G6K93_07690 [Agrobacterium rhizogenes]|nr:hypothetical protein [Rhizobium rhizogenes]